MLHFTLLFLRKSFIYAINKLGEVRIGGSVYKAYK